MQTRSTCFDRASIGGVRVTNVEVDARGEGLPRTRGAARLNDAPFDPKCGVHRFPVRAGRTLGSKFFGSKGRLGEPDEPIGIIDREVQRHRIESGRNVGGALGGGHGLLAKSTLARLMGLSAVKSRTV